MNSVTYQPIGLIRSGFQSPTGMPIQAAAAQDSVGRIELDPAFEAGLQDIDGFSHLILIYHLHLIESGSLTVTPFLDDHSHGIFATRSPKRPNALGLSVVRLLRVEGCTLEIADVDIVDGTPLLDIKPYVPAFDVREAPRIGWFVTRLDGLTSARADDRFQ